MVNGSHKDEEENVLLGHECGLETVTTRRSIYMIELDRMG